MSTLISKLIEQVKWLIGFHVTSLEFLMAFFGGDYTQFKKMLHHTQI